VTADPPGKCLRTILVALGALLVAASAAGAAAPPSRVFAYDAGAPLGLTEGAVEEAGDVRITRLSYASPLGGKVTALLVAPSAARALPAVTWLHDADGSSASARDEAVALARSGIVSLLPDSSWARPPFPRLVTYVAAKDRALRLRSVVEGRRALDVLAARPEVDSKRLGVVGYGPGATSAAILSGVEKRIDAFVLSGTGARITTLLRRLWGASRAAERERYLRALTVFDPVAWSGRAGPAPVFFQHLRNDSNFTFAELRQLDKATAGPKRVRSYTADTKSSPAARRDRAAFLLETLR
jgi:dienelactone hydrolase